MQREVFEAFLTDPIRISEPVFALWLQGLNAGDALSQRLRAREHSAVLGGADRLRELLWRDTVDQYRLFEKLEHYLMRPSLFRSQLLFQVPPPQQRLMVERYYSLHEAVGRWLVGKKLSARLQKDLDEVSDHAHQTLKSCRRELENLRRVYSAMEDRNFVGVMSKLIAEQFLISDGLASVYACVLFLQHARMEVHPTHEATGFLDWNDLIFISALVMTHWIPQRRAISSLQRANTNKYSTDQASKNDKSTPKNQHTATSIGVGGTVVENGAEIALRVDKKWPPLLLIQERLVSTCVRATSGLDLSTRFTNSLRDLKAHLINDSDTLVVYRKRVLKRVETGNQATAFSLSQLEIKLYKIVHGLLTIGAGLSQPKELKDFIGNVVTMVIRVLHECRLEKACIDDVFSALIDSLPELDVWYLNDHETREALLASWERYLSVCRVIAVAVYDQYAARQALMTTAVY